MLKFKHMSQNGEKCISRISCEKRFHIFRVYMVLRNKTEKMHGSLLLKKNNVVDSLSIKATNHPRVPMTFSAAEWYTF